MGEGFLASSGGLLGLPGGSGGLSRVDWGLSECHSLRGGSARNGLRRIVECSEHGGIHSSPQLEMPRWPWQGSFKRVRATRPPQKNYIHKLPINRKAAGASIICAI